MENRSAGILFLVLLVLTQAAAAVFYGVFHNHTLFTTSENFVNTAKQISLWPKFMDIHVMVYVGMAFLFAFIARFKLGAMFQCFWVAALSVQYYHLWKALWTGAWGNYGRFYIATGDLIQAEFCAMAMVIAVGALLGRTNNLQLILVVIIGVFFYTLNEQIVLGSIGTLDHGGSMYIFAYGGFYGLGLAFLFGRSEKLNLTHVLSNVNSNTFAMIGTLFMWCFFPSFNIDASGFSGLYLDNAAVINTYFGLIGSVLGTVFISTILFKGRVNMQHILMSSISGGVIMGAGARLLMEPFVAYIVGSINGILCCFNYGIPDRIFRQLRIRDSAGIIMFALSGFHGGWLSAIYRARWFNSGGLQIAGLFVSIGIAFLSGLILGLILTFFNSHAAFDDYFKDECLIAVDKVLPIDLINSPKVLYYENRLAEYDNQVMQDAY